MAEYPKEFEFDVLLSDGEVIHLRPITPQDAELEDAFIRRVGPQSMYQRFFRAKKELTPEELRYFTGVDYEERMALIALAGDRMVAVGRYDVQEGTDPTDGSVAEVAFLVEDAYQGRGIGSLLLQHLTVYARLKGVTEFEAFVLADNFGMMRLFRTSGYTVTRSLDEDVFRVEFPTTYSPAARAADWEHERRSVTESITPLFLARGIAVVGAEQGTDTAGGRVMRNLLTGSYTGIVYPVNEERTYVHSVKSYHDVSEIPDDIDIALVTLPPDKAVDAVLAAGEKGARAVVVTAWTEDGRDEWRSRLQRAARRSGIRLLGPDSSGIIVTYPEISMQAHTSAASIPPGMVGLATQSGPIGSALLRDVSRVACGLSSFVSLGDESDITANDLLIYWEGDPFTSVVALYVETFGNPRRFGRIARRVSRSKPIVAVKGGRTAIGGTESKNAAVEALFHSSGVIRAETMTEMFDVVRLLQGQPLPGGRRVAVLSDSPGAASLTAGALEVNGLDLPDELPGLEGGSAPNPMIVHPDQLNAGITAAAASGLVDAVVAVQVPHHGPEMPPAPGCEISIPLLVVRMGGEPGAAKNHTAYGYPEPAARALAAAVRYAEWRERPEGELPEYPEVDRPDAKRLIGKCMNRLEDGRMSAEDAGELLNRFGIPFGGTTPEGSVVGRVSVSMSEDDVFGPLILFRMSGTLAELSRDRSFRINPIDDIDAHEMIAEVNAARALEGYGGGEAGDTEALVDLVLRFSYLIENAPEISEARLDPVVVRADGVSVESADIRLRPLEGAFVPSRKDIPGRML